MGTPETSASSHLATAHRRGLQAERSRAERFDATLACALLRGPDLDAGLNYVLQGLDGATPPALPPWLELVALLSQIPFVAACRARARGYAGDPATLDLLLGLTPASDASPFGLTCHQWLATRSATAAALRRRAEWLTRQIERAALDVPGAHVVALHAGHAHELLASPAVAAGSVRATLVEYDVRTIDTLCARAAQLSVPIDVQPGSVADILGGECRRFDCALVYAPSLAAHLPTATVRELVDVLLTWLRPGGRLVLPVHTVLAERGFLAHVADWHPNVVLPERLLSGVVTRRGIAARVEHDHAHGLAYIDLTRLG